MLILHGRAGRGGSKSTGKCMGSSTWRFWFWLWRGSPPPPKKKVSRELTRFPALSQSTIKFKSNYCPVAVFWKATVKPINTCLFVCVHQVQQFLVHLCIQWRSSNLSWHHACIFSSNNIIFCMTPVLQKTIQYDIEEHIVVEERLYKVASVHWGLWVLCLCTVLLR